MSILGLTLEWKPKEDVAYRSHNSVHQQIVGQKVYVTTRVINRFVTTVSVHGRIDNQELHQRGRTFRTPAISAVYSIKTFGDTTDIVGGEDPNGKVYKGEALMSFYHITLLFSMSCRRTD
jgi:hypothetical protein